jgi:hypothetical protein
MGTVRYVISLRNNLQRQIWAYAISSGTLVKLFYFEPHTVTESYKINCNQISVMCLKYSFWCFWGTKGN